MSRFPFAAYATKLSDSRRNEFARFAHQTPADAVREFVRSQCERPSGHLPAPGWFYAGR